MAGNGDSASFKVVIVICCKEEKQKQKVGKGGGGEGREKLSYLILIFWHIRAKTHMYGHNSKKKKKFFFQRGELQEM